MKSFIEEYGLIIVVVCVAIAMMAFAQGGFAKTFQESMEGQIKHVTEIGESHVGEVSGGTE